MKTKKKAKRKQPIVQFRTKNGRPIVELPREEYERLKREADEWEPPMPAPLPDGNYPAVEYARASLARDIIRHRRKLGLTQLELARRAGVKLQTLRRIEQALVSPSVVIVDKVDAALQEAESVRNSQTLTKFIGDIQEFSSQGLSGDDPRLETRVRKGRPGDSKRAVDGKKNRKRKE
jgi:transcriptional regulator with XRE-family HTH domain